MKLAVLVAVLVAAPAPLASAQEPTTDPDAATPAGAIYQLPLDQARADAAPRRPAAGSTNAAGASGSAGSQRRAVPTSALRSENGFGSSSVVPGAEPRARSAGAPGSQSDAASGSGKTGAADGQESGTPEPGAGAGVTGSSGAEAKASAAPSSTRVYLLLALVLAVGIAGGLATRVRAHRDTPA